MNYSLNEIKEITSSEFYNAIPLEAAQEARDDRWWFQHDAMTLAATKLAIWELGSYTAFLFDNYPDIIKKVNLDWATEKSSHHLYLDFYMRINDCRVDEEGVSQPDINLLQEDHDIISNVFSLAQDVIGNQTLPKIETIIEAFSQPIHSKSEALAIISTHAGDIQAKIQAKLQENSLNSNTPLAKNNKQGPRL